MALGPGGRERGHTWDRKSEGKKQWGKGRSGCVARGPRWERWSPVCPGPKDPGPQEILSTGHRPGLGEHSPSKETTDGQWGTSRLGGPAAHSPSLQPFRLPSRAREPHLCGRTVLSSWALLCQHTGPVAPGIVYLTESCPLARTRGCRGVTNPRTPAPLLPAEEPPRCPGARASLGD